MWMFHVPIYVCDNTRMSSKGMYEGGMSRSPGNYFDQLTCLDQHNFKFYRFVVTEKNLQPAHNTLDCAHKLPIRLMKLHVWNYD